MKRCDYFEFKSKNFNILIVEDSSSMIKIINNIFSSLGFNTFLAPTLKEAREIMNSNKIDYIILLCHIVFPCQLVAWRT